MIPRLRPKVVLMDLALLDMGGCQVIRQIADRYGDILFVVLASAAGDEDIYRTLEAGAGASSRSICRRTSLDVVNYQHIQRPFSQNEP